MITSGYEKIGNASVFCSVEAKKLYNASREEDGSCLQNIGARGLYLAQIIVSIVALPLNLLAVIFCPLLALCTEGPKKSWELLQQSVGMEWAHYAFLPVFVLGLFFPEKVNF